MSDMESNRSVSPSRDILHGVANTDEVLNDHRHQASSLPIQRYNFDPRLTRNSSSNQIEPYPVQPKVASHMYMNNLRKDFYLNQGQEDDDSQPFMLHPSSIHKNHSSTNPTTNSRAQSRSRSFSDQVKSFVNPKDGEMDEIHNIGGASSGGILLKPAQPSGHKRSKQRNDSVVDNLENDIASPMMKIKTNDTSTSENQNYKRERRASRSSIDSEADSHASRSSQETEEDVCFPMLREHVRIKGIDFDEIEEFIKDEREEEQLMKDQQQMIADRTAMRVSSNQKDARTTGSISSKSRMSKPSNVALKYTPKNLIKKMKSKNTESRDNESIKTIRNQSDSSTVNDEYDEKTSPTEFHNFNVDDNSSDNVKFGGTRINDSESILPDRFSFFSSESEETIHAPDIPSLVEPGQSVRELFRNGEGTWWLDCVCPTDSEMKMLAKAFGIHPLTAEDIRMQETREKVELFRSYYFVCFHTFEPDKESEDYLEPINVYIVVFRDGVLTFHFSPILHPANVRRRVRQLRDYVDVSADWLCYALIDDITDSFAPVITGIEYEADAIEDSVFVARELDFSNMLQRIGESRRKVMTLMRLLSGKADVIKMFAKRCQDEAQSHTIQSHLNLANLNSGSGSGNATPAPFSNSGVSFGPNPGANPNLLSSQYQQFQNQHGRAQPRADIALYLGDIQDHVVTMFQNLLAYEKIFSRSHSNYLAQLQVESFNSNNKVTEMLSKVTLIGTMLVPLNLVTGLFGMNVHVPGENSDSGLAWFFGILGVMFFIVICSTIFSKIWLRKLDVGNYPGSNQVSSRRSIKSLGLKTRTKEAAKSIISFPNKYD
ncbi:cora-domain-containing protein [Hyphopichia burtonii NRRL Y-1933]|uniref:Cora-domain-containing protein n=1 Tax=Hyphopichia burtonii NRRL Y-1933 TaxID=984485 RepID=A0A1E4RQT6_9ASCO|nr:cora-domain-containing protein [Hyphopichia burtonii NRRL Y-1933]ODV69642.1 cora-domain-containing protein [Hyphopichia burtonii NRRL Y-1933]